MIDAALGICLGFAFVSGVYGVWTWRNVSRKMVEYTDLQADYDALYQIWLKTARENADLRAALDNNTRQHSVKTDKNRRLDPAIDPEAR